MQVVLQNLRFLANKVITVDTPGKPV